MRVTLYSEHKSPEDLGKLGLFDCAIDLSLSARNLDEFRALEAQARKYPQVQRTIYWPLLEKDEGYWPSPFARSEALERIIEEIEHRPGKDRLVVTWDGELPMVAYQDFLLRGARRVYRNKAIVRGFFMRLGDNNVEIETAESPRFLVPEGLQKALGVTFDPNEYGNTQVKMAYTSFFRTQLKRFFGKGIASKIVRAILMKEVRAGLKDYGERFSIGLGCVMNNASFLEGSLSPEELAQDLETARDSQILRVHIYGLEGMNNEYAQVIKGFTG
jgi:hypothetical protein